MWSIFVTARGTWHSVLLWELRTSFCLTYKVLSAHTNQTARKGHSFIGTKNAIFPDIQNLFFISMSHAHLLLFRFPFVFSTPTPSEMKREAEGWEGGESSWKEESPYAFQSRNGELSGSRVSELEASTTPFWGSILDFATAYVTGFNFGFCHCIYLPCQKEKREVTRAGFELATLGLWN